MARTSSHFFSMLISAIIAIALFSGCQPDSFRGTEMPAGLEVADFQLLDQYRKPFHLSGQRDAVVLLFFGYTFCPDVCPLTLSHWKKIADLLGPVADDVRFVYITVDPERDTPDQLAAHLSVFHDDFIGLTGKQKELDKVYKVFGVIHEKVKIAGSSTGYLVNHTARTNLVDQKGNWRLTFAYNTDPEIIAHDIKLLFKK